MFEKNVYEAKVNKLMTEYQELAEELMKKECYYDGLRESICKLAMRYYDTYLGRWSHLHFDKNFIDNAEVRAADIRVEFHGNDLCVIVKVAVNPADLRKDLLLNDKERKLLAKAKRLWKEYADCAHMYNLKEYKEISSELIGLQHEVMLVDDYYYSFNELELMDGKNICRSNLVIGKCHGADILLNMFEEKEND